MNAAREDWEIGLSSWIIQDGNYPDFNVGQDAEFALEFYPRSVRPSEAEAKSAKVLGATKYEINGEVIYLTEEAWVLERDKRRLTPVRSPQTV